MKKICTFILLVIFILMPFSAKAETEVEKWNKHAKNAVKYRIIPQYGDYIYEASAKYNIETRIIIAVIDVETLGHPEEVSPTGAKCLMQTIDGIGKEVGRPGNSCEPRESILRGTAFLARLRDHYKIDGIIKILVAYNIGHNKIKGLSNKEIQNHKYIKKIMYVLKYVPPTYY